MGPKSIDRIFWDAAQIAMAGERAAFLDSACDGDAGLRRRVEQLLEARARAESFLEQPAPALAATVAEPPVAERPGAAVGPFRLLEPMGEGGMGIVWLAQQTEPVKRLVALKLIKPGMDSAQVLARFEAERQALALMDHPNIAHVFDAGVTQEGRPYFVMELVKGLPITEYCDRARLPLRERLALFVDVCGAVQHAHQKGVIHRDLKPSNVMIALYDGRPVPKVIDFGVAKATEQPLTDRTLVTGLGALVGTLEYMSPEQAELNTQDVDTRSDVYSLGVLLYELLTGSTPLERGRSRAAGLLEALRIIREEQTPRPSARLSTAQGLPDIAAHRGVGPEALRGLVRGELDWIALKALEKDRNRRYESASAFAQDVRRYLNDEPVQACPPTLGYRLRKAVRRHRSALLVVSLVVLALVGGLIGLTWGVLRATDEANQKKLALAAAQVSEREAQDSLGLSLYEQARARRFSRQMGQRLDSLEALARAARLRPDERLRDEAIAAMALPDVRLGPSWHVFPAGSRSWAFDANYRRYARGNDRGVISVRSLPEDREIRNIVCAPAPWAYVGLSPDGRYVVSAQVGHKLQVWRVADGKAMLREGPRDTFGWAFSPDGRHLAVGWQSRAFAPDLRGGALRFDLATGRELNRWQLPQGRKAHSLAFHPDNRRLAVGYWVAGFASVFDATSGAHVANLPVGATAEQVVAWHPDGERLAVAGSDPRIQIWDVPAKRKVATLEGHVQHVTYLTFHPDGSLLASYSWDAVLRLWEPATGRQLLQAPVAVIPRFSSDGRWLGVTWHGEQGQLLEAAPTREHRTLVSGLGAGQGGYDLDSDISPDGRLLALSMEDAVRLLHLASGRELAVLPRGRPLFQPDGRELLITGPDGLQRWPIRPGATGNELRLGPPRAVALPARVGRAERSLDGRTLAVISEPEGTGLLVSVATGSVRAPRLAHPAACYVALSGDGRWLATSGWHSDRIRLWNARTGKMVQEWMLGRAKVFFTPDSRALIISQGDELSFHDVGTLKEVRRVRRDVALYPGHVAFSPDGGLMAFEMAPGVIHLKDAASDRTVARLEGPHGDRAGWMSFTPDGTQLVVTAPYARAVHVWDLRAIRVRLKGMGLDWDWPEFRPAARADEPGQRFAEPAWKVQLTQNDAHRFWPLFNKAFGLMARGKPDEAIAYYHKAIEVAPKYSIAHYELGRALHATGRLDEAAAAYRKAIELRPGYAEAYCNLGAALEPLGRFEQALEARRRGHELGRGRPGWRYPSGQWVKRSERLLALDRRLPGVLAGQDAGPAEQANLAELCLQYKGRYADAALLYGKAFAASPGLAEALSLPHRYNAACAAALAGCGQGAGAGGLSAAEKARLRGQARDWLAASLVGIGKHLADHPASARDIEGGLRSWLAEPRLSGVRDAKGLAGLPDEERRRWAELWGEVRDLMRRAGMR
jgi:serine/threonine protein kinase/WD40 repeat protein/tetratricopeptide (TPR) repeat protein